MRRFIGPVLALSLLAFSSVLLAPRAAVADPLGDAPPAASLQQSGGPVAQFTATVPGQTNSGQEARVHDAIAFDASPSQGAGLTYAWDFGDGSQSAGSAQVSHSFGLVDDYTVTLTVTDVSGQSASGSQSVRVVPLIDSLVGVPPLNQVVPGSVVPVTLNVQAPGPATISASLNGDLLTSKPVSFSTGDDLEYLTLAGNVADERNSTIDQRVVRTVGGSIPLRGNVGLALNYKTSAGKSVELSFTTSLQKDRDLSLGTWAITYPNFSLITGVTDPSQPDVDGFYLKGDAFFHHPDDALVRKYAIQAARAGGSFPSDPAQVMENIYTFVGGLFGSDDPAQIEPDTVIAQKIAGGKLKPGDRSEKYICISQTYFLSSLSRTLGLPSRELTIALANPVTQNPRTHEWTVKYYQEGATQVWFAGSWHLYDTWLRVRNLPNYLVPSATQNKVAYQAYYSYSSQSYNMVAKNGDLLDLFGHNFAIGEEDGFPADPTMWGVLDKVQRDGVSVAGFPTDTP